MPNVNKLYKYGGSVLLFEDFIFLIFQTKTFVTQRQMMKYAWLIILLFSLFSRVRNDLETREQKSSVEAITEVVENGKMIYLNRI